MSTCIFREIFLALLGMFLKKDQIICGMCFIARKVPCVQSVKDLRRSTFMSHVTLVAREHTGNMQFYVKCCTHREAR